MVFGNYWTQVYAEDPWIVDEYLGPKSPNNEDAEVPDQIGLNPPPL